MQAKGLSALPVSPAGDEVELEPDAAETVAAAESPAVGEKVDEHAAVCCRLVGAQVQMFERVEARPAVRYLDEEGLVGAVDEQAYLLAGCEACVPERVGDKLAGEKPGDELEVFVRGQFGEGARIEVDVDGENFVFREIQIAEPLALAEH